MMEDLTIGAVARRTGVPVSAIRYYESLGLLSLPQRINGRRHYDQRVFQQLVLIQLARQAGFGIRAIQTLFAAPHDDTPTAPAWQTLATQKITEIDAQIERMLALKAWLIDALRQPCRSEEQCVSVSVDERSSGIQITLHDGRLDLPAGFGARSGVAGDHRTAACAR
jgi:MerR family redox-sensitive transcriptional activator SoxR